MQVADRCASHHSEKLGGRLDVREPKNRDHPSGAIRALRRRAEWVCGLLNDLSNFANQRREPNRPVGPSDMSSTFPAVERVRYLGAAGTSRRCQQKTTEKAIFISLYSDRTLAEMIVEGPRATVVVFNPKKIHCCVVLKQQNTEVAHLRPAEASHPFFNAPLHRRYGNVTLLNAN
jgi:hypothetical protein